MGDSFQDPQWMPETMDSTVFSCVSLSIAHIIPELICPSMFFALVPFLHHYLCHYLLHFWAIIKWNKDYSNISTVLLWQSNLIPETSWVNTVYIVWIHWTKRWCTPQAYGMPSSHASQNGTYFKTSELLISEIFCLILSDHSWLRPTETRGSEAMDGVVGRGTSILVFVFP